MHEPPGGNRPESNDPRTPADISSTAPNWEFASKSRAYREAMADFRLYARTDEPIVIEGKTGTGKSLLGDWIHKHSLRAGKSFHWVTLAGTEDSHALSDLCGHEKGAYTGALERRKGAFELADGGTLFVDELASATSVVQRRLLGPLDRGELYRLGGSVLIRVDVRIIVAVNERIDALVRKGHLLDDLVGRLGKFRIYLPELSERRGDIPALVRQLIRQNAHRYGYGEALPEVDSRLMQALVDAEWPGNLRDLASTVRLLLVRAQGEAVLGLWHCGGPLAELLRAAKTTRSAVRKEGVARELADGRRNASEVAAKFGVSRMTIHRDRQESQAR